MVRNSKGYYSFFDNRGKQIKKDDFGNIILTEYTENKKMYEKDKNGKIIFYDSNFRPLENSRAGVPLYPEYNAPMNFSKI